jgi:hypothetical protein
MKKRFKLAEQRGENAIYDYSFLAKAFQLPTNESPQQSNAQLTNDSTSEQEIYNVEAVSGESSPDDLNRFNVDSVEGGGLSER